MTLHGTAEAFATAFHVSRETLARLQVLHDLLLKWNRRINLVSPASESSLWSRHIADSAQLYALAPNRPVHWADIGSGGGFPGLVVAILASAAGISTRITLIESDARKCVFLAEASRATATTVTVLQRRIETLDPLKADVVSARALAPLDVLLGHYEKHRGLGGIGLFPKGATVHKEIEAASRRWRFDHHTHPSVTAADAAIVQVGEVSRV